MPDYDGIPPSSSVIVHNTTTSRSLPITQIAFPSSPSPIPPLHGSSSHLPLSKDEHEEAVGAARYHKLSFLTFDGKEDPLGWINRCDYFFPAQRMRETDKVSLASFHLIGVAQHWFYMLEKDVGGISALSWPLFKTTVRSTLGYESLGRSGEVAVSGIGGNISGSVPL